MRALGIDVANLTSRLAVMNATLEHLIELASQITPMAWASDTVQDGGGQIPDGTQLISVTNDEAQRVLNLVGEVLALRAP